MGVQVGHKWVTTFGGEASWGLLGPCWALLGSFWGLLGPSWSLSEPSWGHLGAVLGPSWGHLRPSWGHLGACWGHLGLLPSPPPRPRRQSLEFNCSSSNSMVFVRPPPKDYKCYKHCNPPPVDAPDYHPRPLMGTTYYVMQSFRKQDGPAECAKRLNNFKLGLGPFSG